MSRKEWTRRFLLFLLSLFFTAMGVALTKHGALGVSPISSVGNVMSCRFPALSLGNWLILWNCLLILGQMLLLGRRFRLFQLLQLPLSFLFGWFTDFGLWCVAALPAERYALRLLWVFCGIAVLAFGVSLAVIADVIMNSGEAFVKAVTDRFGGNFGSVKVGFDVACVLLSVGLSLLLFEGEIVGTREGTILTALLTGFAVKWFVARLEGPSPRESHPAPGGSGVTCRPSHEKIEKRKGPGYQPGPLIFATSPGAPGAEAAGGRLCR